MILLLQIFSSIPWTHFSKSSLTIIWSYSFWWRVSVSNSNILSFTIFSSSPDSSWRFKSLYSIASFVGGNKKIVIIGSTGHLGYNVAKCLLKKNKNILLLIRKKNIYTTELVNSGAKIKLVNFNKLKEINKIIKNQDILINTASRNPYNPSGNILKDNYDITKNIFNSTIKTSIKKIINISSSVIFKRKLSKSDKINEKSELNFFENDYVKGKILSEKFIDKFELKERKTIIRLYPGWIIGNDDIFLTPPSKFFYKKIYKKKLIPCFKGGISINGVEEIADAIISSININKNQKQILIK